MPDIQMRFDKDMLVLSGRLDAVFARQGVDTAYDREFLNLVEPDSVREAYRLESVAGAQCLVTNTEGITRARLAHARLEERAPELAAAALTVVSSLKPQHVIYEVGPCGLPLDPSSSASLKQSRNQYAQAVRDLEGASVDAVLFSGFEKLLDAQCALMGLRMVSGLPAFVCLTAVSSQSGSSEKAGGASADKEGACGLALRPRSGMWAEAAALLEEYGASVIGFSSGAPLEMVEAAVRDLRAATDLPLMVELAVGKRDARQQAATSENPYFCPDAMVEAAVRLRAAGVQFLRAGGACTPAYTGALVAATAGFDVVGKDR